MENFGILLEEYGKCQLFASDRNVTGNMEKSGNVKGNYGERCDIFASDTVPHVAGILLT